MEMAQVGMRMPRAQAAMATDAAAETGSSGSTKKRKGGSGDGEMEFSSSTLVHLKTCRRAVEMPENSVSPAQSMNSGTGRELKESCSSCGSDPAPELCYSSNGSSEIASESLKCVDLQESADIAFLNYNCSERRDMTPPSEVQSESDELESTARPSAANSRLRSAAEKMPSQAELEEFFAAAEKDLQKRFADRYNYDIVKDVPLEGRYEWVRLKP